MIIGELRPLLDCALVDPRGADVPPPRALGQKVRAVDQRVLAAGDAEEAELRHGLGEVAVPAALVADEAAELLAHGRVRREVLVAGDDEDARGRVEGLAVVLDVPDARGGVLRLAGAGGVDEALLGGGVRAEQGRQLLGVEALVLKELEQDVARGSGVGEEAVRVRDRRVLAADEGLDLRAQGACGDGVGCRRSTLASWLPGDGVVGQTYRLRTGACPRHRRCCSAPG